MGSSNGVEKEEHPTPPAREAEPATPATEAESAATDRAGHGAGVASKGLSAKPRNGVALPDVAIERSRRSEGRMDVRVVLLDVEPEAALRIGAALLGALREVA